MRRQTVTLARTLAAALLLVALATAVVPAPASADAPVRVQLGFVIDGSQSMFASDFVLMKYAIANALADTSIVPHDGSVEICVVQIGVDASVTGIVEELAPIAVTTNSIGYIKSHLRNMTKGDGYTPTAKGIDMCTSLIVNSPNFGAAQRQVINVATDGQPYDHKEYPTLPDNEIYERSKEDALAARDRAQAAGIDEIDAEMVGRLTARPGQIDWFLDLVYPKPAAKVPPDAMKPGFARLVADLNDFDVAIYEKLAIVLYPTYTPTPTSTNTSTTTTTPTPTATWTATTTHTSGPDDAALTQTAWAAGTRTPSDPERTQTAVAGELTQTAIAGSTATPSPSATPAPEVPEPGSLALLAGGLAAAAGYWGMRRRGRG